MSTKMYATPLYYTQYQWFSCQVIYIDTYDDVTGALTEHRKMYLVDKNKLYASLEHILPDILVTVGDATYRYIPNYNASWGYYDVDSTGYYYTDTKYSCEESPWELEKIPQGMMLPNGYDNNFYTKDSVKYWYPRGAFYALYNGSYSYTAWQGLVLWRKNDKSANKKIISIASDDLSNAVFQNNFLPILQQNFCWEYYVITGGEFLKSVTTLDDATFVVDSNHVQNYWQYNSSTGCFVWQHPTLLPPDNLPATLPYGNEVWGIINPDTSKIIAKFIRNKDDNSFVYWRSGGMSDYYNHWYYPLFLYPYYKIVWRAEEQCYFYSYYSPRPSGELVNPTQPATNQYPIYKSSPDNPYVFNCINADYMPTAALKNPFTLIRLEGCYASNLNAQYCPVGTNDVCSTQVRTPYINGQAQLFKQSEMLVGQIKDQLK